jgi:hypothetical protein
MRRPKLKPIGRRSYICRQCGHRVDPDRESRDGYPFCMKCWNEPLGPSGVGNVSPPGTSGLDGDPDAWRPSWVQD